MAFETGLRQSETVEIILVILIPSNIKNIIPFLALHLMQLLSD